MGKKIDWAKNLEKLSKKKEKKPQGDGWFMIHDFVVNADVGIDRAYKLMKRGLEDKVIEKYQGSEFCAEHNQIVKRTWYRFIDNN